MENNNLEGNIEIQKQVERDIQKISILAKPTVVQVKKENNYSNVLVHLWFVIKKVFYNISLLSIFLIKWLVIYIMTFIVYNLYLNIHRIYLGYKKSFYKNISKSFASWGFVFLFVLILFLIMFGKIIIYMFTYNYLPFMNLLLTPYNIVNSFGLTIFIMTGCIFGISYIFNIFYLCMFEQTLGMIIFKEKFVHRNNKQVTIVQKILYAFIFLVLFGTIFVWPLFLCIWSVLLFSSVIFKTNLIHKILGIKVIKTYKTEKHHLSFSNLYLKNSGFVENITGNRSSNLLNDKNHFFSNNFFVNSESLITGIIPFSLIRKEYSVKKMYSFLFIGNIKNYISSIVNCAIFVLFSWIIVSNTRISDLFQNNTFALKKILLAVFFGIKNTFITIFASNQIITMMTNFHDSLGNYTSNFIGESGVINYADHSITYSIAFIPSSIRWPDIWNNINFFLDCISINLKYSPVTTIVWITIFLILISIVTNIIVYLFYGNSLLGAMFTKTRLINDDTHLPLSFFERLFYVIFYIVWLIFFFIPIVNIVWIIINIICFAKEKRSFLNAVFHTRKSKNKFYYTEIDKGIKFTNNFIDKFFGIVKINKKPYKDYE